MRDFYKYQFSYDLSSFCSLQIPVKNEDEVHELAHRLANEENFRHKLGLDIMGHRLFCDISDTGVRSVIKRMMKILISEEICNRMNTTGRSSKLSANCDGSSVKAIKTPESIIRFLAKCSGHLASINEEVAYVEVKKVITRWISDERNNKFLRRNRRLKQRFERQMMNMNSPLTLPPVVSLHPQIDHITNMPNNPPLPLMNMLNARLHRPLLETHIRQTLRGKDRDPFDVHMLN